MRFQRSPLLFMSVPERTRHLRPVSETPLILQPSPAISAVSHGEPISPILCHQTSKGFKAST